MQGMELGHFYPPFGSKDQPRFVSTPPRSFSNRISPPPTECLSLDCPVKERHHKYEYWHNGKQPHREDWDVFHGSNPPGNVWRSYNRLQCQKRRGSCCGTMADIERVRQFRRYHGCCKSKSDDDLDLQLSWRSQEKLWEMAILAEGEGIPERTGKEKENPMTTEHHKKRVIQTVDYLQPGDKSPYHEHRMRVLKYRQRQKDKRWEKEKSLR